MHRRAIASFLATTLVATFATTSADAKGPDILAALGPSARVLPNGLYEVTLGDGTTLRTHGPDPIPSDHGDDINTGDAERAPVCATDYHQHILYGRPNGGLDRLAQVRDTIMSAVRRMNAVLNEEAIETGGRFADYKVRCGPTGEIAIGSFVSGGSAFTTIADAARAAGYDESNADYSIFYDGTLDGVCGTGSLEPDDRLATSNLNNSGGGYAVTYVNCWSNRTPMHENGHNQGAVQVNAPYSTGNGYHCYDAYDVMCYSPDGGNRNQGGTIDRCTDRLHLDCAHDTYFDLDPDPDEWLASHWNLGSSLNRFIQIAEPVEGPPDAAMAIDCSGQSCSFTDWSIDDSGVTTWEWRFGDGATATDQHPQHTYAEDDTYIVALTATDTSGETDTLEQTLVVPNEGDSDPAIPNLSNGSTIHDSNGAQGTWRTYKIVVPPSADSFNVTLDGPPCIALLVCNPDLDLFLRRGQAPTQDRFECAAEALSNDEVCSISDPVPGTYYVGVYTFFALPGPGSNLSIVQYALTASY